MSLSNMGQHWLIVYLLAVCVHLSHQRSIPSDSTYKAAVVEYPPQYFTNGIETLKVNSDAYVRIITAAASDYADIIVMPEDGLTTFTFPERAEMGDWTTIIPSASDNYTPCTQDTIEVSEALKKISCAARNNEIYVVLNIAEKEACTAEPCTNDKVFYYNSNVVFDRTGKIIARYRKTHLYEEHKFNVRAVPEVVTFDTDFGVKFGTFICFDILFHEPALNLTRDLQVTDIVYPTAWFSILPFLTAVQTQAGWSFAEDVNLLASGYNKPSYGIGGSGIYLGRHGIGTSIMPTTTHEKLLIYDVPKMMRTSHHDQSKDREDANDKLRKKRENDDGTTTIEDKIFLLTNNFSYFKSIALEGSTTETVCQNDFCCDFKVEVANIDPKTKYCLMVSNGRHRFSSNVDGGVRGCGVIQCATDVNSSYFSANRSKTVFSNIEIAATFHDYKNNLIMPSTLNSDILPLNYWVLNEYTHNDDIHVNMTIQNNNINNLVTFGIFSRNFKEDIESKPLFNIIQNK
ncbi:vanin-like protein 1 isoform X2 [Solenopsis invicta]|nr:vanin-like protein 1 isoform X2 [Solenopsis invicta]XP_039307517.1 vanin-like protein 1 isoform X2 [Solenopsis invicta]